MAELPFIRTFPEWEGYRFFLADVPTSRTAGVSEILEARLSDFGVDAGLTAERLAAFHRVEYTYLSTFQALGGLGLVLGTLGLGAVLLRNVLERRRELAVLRALGYRRSDFFVMVVAENVFLLMCGLAAGTGSALLAIAPTLLDRGGQLPAASLVVLLLGVMVTGLMASIGATAAALRSPLLPALRSE
jgi:ABC-type antimicrobial peptide transport system permease subunit